jgi:hypothetical protein
LQKKRGEIDSVIETLDGAIAKLAPLASAEGPKDRKLRGRAIRDVAIPLLARDHGAAPIHYRDWLALLEAQGHEVAGKRPDAVFLNQVTRHPAVRATTSSGLYCLDPAALPQILDTAPTQPEEEQR